MKNLLKILVCTSLLTFALTAHSQEVKPEAQPKEVTVRLWDGDAPLAQGQAPKDIPTLTIYTPQNESTGAAIVICPGGGYNGLSDYEYEAAGYARFLIKHGITVFALRYRVASGGYHHPVMLMDAARAVRYVRYHAKEWNIDVNRIAIMGSSAGGHLASALATHFEKENPAVLDPIDRLSSRPDMAILCYPVISMVEYIQIDSKNNLLGTTPSQGLCEYMSTEKQVSPETPPCFIWHTCEDEIVPTENSMLFAMALRKYHIPFELHIFEKGIHGLALAGERYKSTLGMEEKDFHQWSKDLLVWLKARGWAN